MALCLKMESLEIVGGDFVGQVSCAPFAQIDTIGAMVIVWRVRGKIIMSVLWNIVRNNCAQCNAHTYEQT